MKKQAKKEKDFLKKDFSNLSIHWRWHGSYVRIWWSDDPFDAFEIVSKECFERMKSMFARFSIPIVEEKED